MTTPTFHQAQGLSIHWKPPIMATSAPGGGDRITDDIGSISFEKVADGGNWAGTIPMSLPTQKAEEWYAEGLGRDITMYDPQLDEVFNGFVDNVRLNAGGLATETGSLLSIANRDSVTYALVIDNTVYPPIVGNQTTTTVADNTDSQALYGIVEKVFSGEPGELTTAEAEQQRDAKLRELAWPKAGESLNLSGEAGPVTVSLEIKGYPHFFNAYVIDDVTPGVIALSDKVKLAIDYDPNGLFSRDFSRIEENAFLVAQADADNRFAWAVLQNLVAIGNEANDLRATLGVYAGRRVEYRTIPQRPLYQHRLADPSQRIEIYGLGEEVKPWRVRPGEWIFFPDFLVGRTQPNLDLARDDRYMFIESVRFSDPYNVQLTGKAQGQLQQALAKKSMWG